MSRVLVAAVLFLVTAVTAVLGDDDVLKKADQAFADHNYKTALGHYRAALQSPEHRDAADRVRRRIGLCLGHLKKYGEARKALLDATRLASTPRDKARAQVERGVLSLTMPQYYYEKDGVKQWGRWVQGATYHHVGHDLRRTGLADLEAAAAFYHAALDDAVSGDKEARASFAGEHFRSMLELASALELVRQSDGVNDIEVAAGATGYGALPSLNARMAWAFDQAGSAQGRLGNKQSQVMAGYLKAMAFRRLMESHRSFEWKEGRIRCTPWGSNAKVMVLPDEWNPLKILSGLVPQARKSALGDEVLYALATIQRRLTLYVDAVATCKKLIDQHPRSRLVPDARAAVEQMTFPRLSLETGRTIAPGVEPKAQLRTRNVKEVRVRVFRFPLDRILGNDSVVKNAELVLGQAQHLIDALPGSPHAGGEVASLSHRTADAGRHLPREETLSLPITKEGCYLVEATAGDLVYRDLVVVSSLGIVRQVDGDRTLVFAVDTKTGAPLENVDLLVRHRYRVRGLTGWRWIVKPVRGKTDKDGVLEVPHPSGGQTSGRYVGVYAHDGARSALVDPTWYRTRRSATARPMAYVFTDRPVYRPGHTVNFAALLRSRLDGDYSSLANQHVSVEIRDPRGTTIFNQAIKTDETGAFDASIALGDEPPLGRYRIRLKRGRRSVGSGAFRVEEYKKPEFEVIVKGPDQQLRLGAGCSAIIQGRYYFGAPVAGGTVAYRVFRERFYPRFRRHEPYRELYGSIPGNVDPSDRGRGRELVTRGEGTLDANGKLVIEWSSKPYADGYPDEDSRFVVQADVTDSSRRTISGVGRLPVTRTAFVVQMASQRGFWAQGETATFEIQAQTPGGRPIATNGKARVYRVTQEMHDGKPHDVLTQILEEDASTDARGMGFFRWVADEAGRFVVSYQARDAWDELVRGDIPVWVHGSGFTADGFQMKNLEIITDKRVYEPGETALVMVNSNHSDSAVLLCLQAGDRTLHREVLRLDGKTAVLSLPITDAYVPNVHLTAYTVRDGGFFAVNHEILVPPTGQLLDVALAFDKPQYQPGERGEATVSVKDKDGRPVPARVALTCLDSSIFYIQQDQTPDIRRFFYGSRRSRGTNHAGSLRHAFRGYLARDVKWGEFDTSGWLPAWSKRRGRVRRILLNRAFGRDELFEGLAEKELHDAEQPEEETEEDAAAAWGEDKRRSPARRSRGALGADDAAPPGAPMESKAEGFGGRASGGKKGKANAREGEPSTVTADGGGGDEPEVRSDFRDTAVWAPEVQCDANGVGKITIPFPQSLTTWRAKAVAWTGDTKVGTTTADAITTKDVLVRLQAPRFFTEGDRIVVSAVVNNRSKRALEARTSILVEGGTLRLSGDAETSVRIAANGEARIDWWCDVIGHGDARVTVKALTAEDSDAMRMTFPVQPWGALKTVTQSGVVTEAAKSTFAVHVPAMRRVESSELLVTLQPSLALSLLDALPYLIDYPYGCTEQTMSRFIPAVACARTLREAGTSLSQIRDARKNLAKAEKRGGSSAVLSDAMLDDVVRSGLQRIVGMQNGDGGWGWWKSDRSSPYLTSYVVSGLLIARDADYPVSKRVLDRAVSFLAKQAPNIKQIQTGAYVSYALAKAGKADDELMARVYKARDDLGVFGNALLASAYAASGNEGRAKIIVSNFENTVFEDKDWGTAHWKADGPGWRWWSSPIEANAAVLNALLDVDPDHRWTAPLVKWLVTNRQGGRWSNTRDTALAILSLVRYARHAGELDPDYTVEVACAGQTRTFKVDRSNMFTFDNRFILRGAAVPTGVSPLEVTVRGKGRVYLTSSFTCFTKEDKITAAGHELFVNRSYHKVTEKATETESNGRKITKISDVLTEVAEGSEVKTGDIIEVRLEIETKNDFEYLMFEDMKPAGFEPLQLRSGRSYDRGICSNVEFRDEKTAFFVTWLQQGKHTLKYRVRAEVPGTLRALPARGEAMYAPTFKGISDSFKLTVKDLERVR